MTILVSLGLFRGSNGARILVTIVFLLNIVGAILLAVNGVPIWAVIASIVLPLLGIILLFTSRANEFFRS